MRSDYTTGLSFPPHVLRTNQNYIITYRIHLIQIGTAVMTLHSFTELRQLCQTH